MQSFQQHFSALLHAVGLQSVQGFQAWAKGVPVKSREGSLSEEGMELGK